MFHPLERLHLLFDGYQRAFKVGSVELLLIQEAEQVYLIENRCPHMDAPLTFASVRGDVIRCPMHGIEFNLKTGAGNTPAPLAPIKTYVPIYEGNMIGIDVATIT
ncbi:MAG: rieske [Cellvibrionaceae bacterium]|nr:rieske [Cellvibrionaceae bacterium]|tara:strand:- start:1375 stop:1689 length:315 start_codon:yes stop_codon:yes gene_type:complete